MKRFNFLKKLANTPPCGFKWASRVLGLVLVLLTLGFGQMWGENYNQAIDYSSLESMLNGNYTDASSYWKVPGTAGNTGTVTIPNTYFSNQPTGNVTLILSLATFGEGYNPSTNTVTITARGTEANTNWTSSSYTGTLPNNSTYKNITLTLTRPNNPTQLGGVQITLGVNTGVKIFRLKSVTVQYAYSACSNSVTINKGTATNCDFNLSKSGAQASCSGVSTTVTISPNTGYGTPVVNQTGASITPTFGGSGNSQTITYQANTTGTSNVTVSCSANNYTITLNNQSATTAGTASIQATYNASTNLTSAINVPEKTGWTFGGYFTQVGGGGTQIIDASGNVLASKTGYTDSNKKWIKADNVTLYAKWTRTVTWSVNGATNVYSASTVTYNPSGSKVSSLPTAPNPASYCGDKFVGWTTDAEYIHGTSPLFTTAADSPNLNSITTAVTFYAVFADYAQ